SGDRKFVGAQDAGTCAPAISAGHSYTISAWYKSTRQPYIFVYYRNSAGSWVYWTQSAKLAVAAAWAQASFTTPAVPAGATNISVGMGLDGVGSLTMDDFGLVVAN
ncbi:MAG: polysaccharide deacetylase, partial [Candidatus Dormibacteraeota bacterium]|nr:polysaccharide deacetylase [Candidatus Dormibacteraeota bacterium]